MDMTIILTTRLIAAIFYFCLLYKVKTKTFCQTQGLLSFHKSSRQSNFLTTTPQMQHNAFFSLRDVHKNKTAYKTDTASQLTIDTHLVKAFRARTVKSLVKK